MRAKEREYRDTDIYRKKAVLHSSSNEFYVCNLLGLRSKSGSQYFTRHGHPQSSEKDGI
jgi:hypothetical protein